MRSSVPVGEGLNQRTIRLRKITPAADRGRRPPQTDLRVRGTGEALVRVAAPVNEHQQVTIAHLRHPPVQLGEVRRSVDEGSDHVALGLGRALAMAGVQSIRSRFLSNSSMTTLGTSN